MPTIHSSRHRKLFLKIFGQESSENFLVQRRMDGGEGTTWRIKMNIQTGMDLRKSLKKASSMGCDVGWPRRTGEVTVRHPRLDWSVRVNSRRKDSPRCLTSFLKELAGLLGGQQ